MRKAKTSPADCYHRKRKCTYSLLHATAFFSFVVLSSTSSSHGIANSDRGFYPWWHRLSVFSFPLDTRAQRIRRCALPKDVFNVRYDLIPQPHPSTLSLESESTLCCSFNRVCFVGAKQPLTWRTWVGALNRISLRSGTMMFLLFALAFVNASDQVFYFKALLERD